MVQFHYSFSNPFTRECDSTLCTQCVWWPNYGEYYTNEIVRINTTSFAVRFRFIVFRPFVDEILVGKIRSCSTEGVRGTVHVYNFVLRLSHSCRCAKELSLVPTRGELMYWCAELPHLYFLILESIAWCRHPTQNFVLHSILGVSCVRLPYILLRMVCMEMIATVSFCCVSSFQFLWASLMTF